MHSVFRNDIDESQYMLTVTKSRDIDCSASLLRAITKVVFLENNGPFHTAMFAKYSTKRCEPQTICCIVLFNSCARP